MNWLEIAKTLPLNQSCRSDCECGTGNTMVINHNIKCYSCFCFRCDFSSREWKGKLSLKDLKHIERLNEEANKPHPVTLPSDMTNDIPPQGRLWLYTCGITETMWRQYRIGWSDKLSRVILPVYNNNEVVWWQGRSVDPLIKPKYLQPSANRETVMFSTNTDTDKCVVVEDIASAIRVGKTITAHSLLGTSVTTQQLNRLGKYKQVIVWLDSDGAGRSGAYKLRRGLSLVTDVVSVETVGDPKTLSDEQIQNVLKEYIDDNIL